MSRNPNPCPRPTTPYRSIASQMRPAHLDAVAVAEAAELRGDAGAAFRAHRSVPMFVQSTHGDRLQVLAELGGAAPDWLVARWMTEQARRVVPQRSQADVLRVVVPALYPRGFDIEDFDVDWPEQVMPHVYMRDWVVRQYDVYDLGRLRELLEKRATPQLLGRAGSIAAWCDAPMGGYRFEGVEDDVVVLTDLERDRRVEVVDRGLGESLTPETTVIGRLVPTVESPSLMFDIRPLEVEESAAVAVAKSPQRWLLVLRMKVRAGRLPRAFSYQPEVSWTADLPEMSWLTLVGLEPGWRLAEPPHALAEQALDVVLRTATDDTAALEGIRHRVSELLLDVHLSEDACLRQATPARLAAWRRLATTLDGPAQLRCQTMVLWSDAAA